ncbi:hypothetical protein TBK1r_71700 [Stieleria magnilauensis]|uniref:Uncharacterized protein n=1 Tax=Stieleria magnilauensis TaxID=2527963 RepID=A0ABX5Y1J1_9BACT|nr:hypothetical protein TBK1r_71700 [Planctomycetes bacterium TBK1r]
MGKLDRWGHSSLTDHGKHFGLNVGATEKGSSCNLRNDDWAHGWQREPTDFLHPVIRGFALLSVGIFFGGQLRKMLECFVEIES